VSVAWLQHVTDKFSCQECCLLSAAGWITGVVRDIAGGAVMG
jgi:hypothetical protein